MTRTIFRSAFLVGISVFLICTGLFFVLQYTQTLEETYSALGQEALYAEKGLMLGGKEYLASLDDVNRVTWIREDGEVIYDSEFDLPVSNQGGFPEVVKALRDGDGYGSRRSGSSGVTTMYYAVKCEDGTILRLSRPLSAVRYALVAISPVLWVLILVALISGVLAFRLASLIVAPINEIDLDHPEQNNYPELSPLIEKIHEQKQTIYEEISQREQLRREFSANVSHELKTPLTSISGFAELMSSGNVSQDKMVEFSQDIYKEARRAINLVNDIIKLSKLDEGEIDRQKEDVDLYQLCSEVITNMQPVAESASVTLELKGKKTVIQGVRAILSEMIYNLCDNAIKYNVPGGKVTISLSETKKEVTLIVKDTGIGIPAEHQKRVFERFYRVDKSHSKEIGGTGLGLSIVKHGVLLHDAKIALASTPGSGTQITLTFPVKG